MTNTPTEIARTLREHAEGKARLDEDAALKTLLLEDAKQLFHELRVHQIELEMQNMELRRTQHELKVSVPAPCRGRGWDSPSADVCSL